MSHSEGGGLGTSSSTLLRGKGSGLDPRDTRDERHTKRKRCSIESVSRQPRRVEAQLEGIPEEDTERLWTPVSRDSLE